MGKGSPIPDQIRTTDQQQEQQIICRPPGSAAEELELLSLYTPDKYKCGLSDELRKIAKKELREDDSAREQALATMRDWIQKTSYIKNCRLDANFLLRFLRVKKFSVPLACDTLVKYIIMRQENPAWFHHTTINDPMVLDLINRGVAFALPGRDKHGRRVMFTIGGNIDPNYHTSESVMKAIMLTFESMLECEENQIRGFSHILDESGITIPHLVLWNPSEIAKIFMACEKSMPMRHKSLDFISLPPLLNYVYEFATRTFMSQKLKSRIKLHKNSASMSQHISPKILPKEYGGEIPLAEMIESFKLELINKNTSSRIQALDQMEVDLVLKAKADAAAAKSSTCPSNIFFGVDALGMGGSFKRLEID